MLYHEGCKITVGGSWQIDEVVPSDPVEDRRSIAEAVKVAAKADVVVLAIGGNEQTSREAWMGNHLGDRTNLDMVGRQDELVDAIAATGKPIVAFVFNGRPLSIRNLAEKAAAIFECWYLGQETGTAVAEALFGDVNPGGKLPITIPRSVGHTPCVLQLPALGPARLFVRRRFAAVSVRLWAELHDVPVWAAATGEGVDRQERVDALIGGRDEYGRAVGRRGRADVYPRPGQFGHAAGEGAEGFSADHACARRDEDSGTRRSRRIGSPSGTSTSSLSSSRASLT